MKELSIEEKAKAYDEAIKKLRSLHNNYDTVSTLIDVKEELENIFPELKERKEIEDDKIVKHLITLFKNDYGKNSNARFAGIKVKDIIAWLEKQGEQKHAEWSKEDERNFDIIYGIIYNSCIAEDASRLNAWLKSLRPQKQWKPSKEQLEALRRAHLRCPDVEDGLLLREIIEQLKKLREE